MLAGGDIDAGKPLSGLEPRTVARSGQVRWVPDLFDPAGKLIRAGEATPTDVPKTTALNDWLRTLGSTGLNRYGTSRAYVSDEWLPQLRDPKSRHQAFRQMAENNGVAGGALRAIKMMVRRLATRVEPFSQEQPHLDQAKFVEDCLADMAMTWGQTVYEIMSCLEHGFSWHEIVLKRRRGHDPKNPLKSSRYDDNMIGWGGWMPKSQEWTNGWVYASLEDGGHLLGLRQLAPPDFGEVIVPRVKSLHFRLEPRLDNPEGSSILRTAYRHHWFVTRLEELEGIALERNLAGLPTAWAPPEYFSGAATADMKVVLDYLDRMVRDVRRDSREGLVLPRSFDDKGNPLFGFELLMGNDGGRAQAMDMAIRRHEARIAGSLLADFMLLGQEGSSAAFALSADKTSLFLMALDAIAEVISDEINDQAIPWLFRWNDWDPLEAPKLKFESAKRVNLTELAAYISALSASQIMGITGNTELAKHLFSVADLPELKDEDIEAAQSFQEQQALMQTMTMQGIDPQTGESVMPEPPPDPSMLPPDPDQRAAEQQAQEDQAIRQKRIKDGYDPEEGKQPIVPGAVQQAADQADEKKAIRQKRIADGFDPDKGAKPIVPGAHAQKQKEAQLKRSNPGGTAKGQSPSKSKAKGGASSGGSSDRPQRPRTVKKAADWPYGVRRRRP